MNNVERQFVRLQNSTFELVQLILARLDKLQSLHSNVILSNIDQIHRQDNSSVIRVYGVQFLDKKSGLRRLGLVCSSNTEEAYNQILSFAKSVEVDVSNWIAEDDAFIEIPLGFKKIDVVEPSNYIAYINNLLLARDKFAETASEKRVLTKLVNKIKEKYGTSSR